MLALTEVGIEILPAGVVVEGPMQVGVAADDAHNVRLLIGGEGLRPGGHLDLEGSFGSVGVGAVGGGRLGVGSGISGEMLDGVGQCGLEPVVGGEHRVVEGGDVGIG